MTLEDFPPPEHDGWYPDPVGKGWRFGCRNGWLAVTARRKPEPSPRQLARVHTQV